MLTLTQTGRRLQAEGRLRLAAYFLGAYRIAREYGDAIPIDTLRETLDLATDGHRDIQRHDVALRLLDDRLQLLKERCASPNELLNHTLDHAEPVNVDDTYEIALAL